MKKIILTISLVFSATLFAQKSNIESAGKLLTSNPSEALALLNKAKSEITSSTEPQLLVDFHYYSGVLNLQKNNILEASKDYSKVAQLESAGFYEGKSKTSKEKVYFLTEKEAKKAESNGEIEKVKQKTLSPKYTDLIRNSLQPKLNEVNTEAVTAYESKNYAKAGQKFSEVYFLMKALNAENPTHYYYSAIAYYSAGKKDEALQIANELIEMGYTGVSTIYTAENKKTKETVTANNKQEFDLLKINPEYTNFKEEKTPSIEGEIYNLATVIYSEKEEYAKALEICEKGLIKEPQNKSLLSVRSNLYLKSGQSDKFIQALTENVSKNPNDYESLYNLGVMNAEIPENQEKAKDFYLKAIQANQNYTQAYINLSALIMKPDSEIVKQMNATKDSKKVNELYKKRQELFNQALPYLEKAHQLDSKDEAVISFLKSSYGILENDAKYKEFSEKLKTLQK